jgi:hypothetical protein
MNPLWVIQRYTPRMQVLALLSARQLERRGYLVRVAEETEGSWDLIRAFVVLAVRPRRLGWLEFIRRVSFRFRRFTVSQTKGGAR